MAKYNIPFGIIKDDDLCYISSVDVSFNKHDIEELEQFIIDHDYSYEFVDIPGYMYDKCMDRAWDRALTEFKDLQQSELGYQMVLFEAIPWSLLDAISPESREKVMDNMPDEYFDDDEEGDTTPESINVEREDNSNKQTKTPTTVDAQKGPNKNSQLMHRHEFDAAARGYDYSDRANDIQALLLLREQFVKHFTVDFIKNMKLDDYCIGSGRKNITCFCYAIEQSFRDLGVILGSTAQKFGIYYSTKENTYNYTSKFGDSRIKAFNAVKRNLVSLIEAGKEGDIDKIVNNIFSPMVKGKILSLYYPDKYLNIFSEDHLDHFLNKLGIGTEDLYASDSIYKRKAIVDFKNDDAYLATWEMDKFSSFLYYIFPIDDDNRGGLISDSDYFMSVGEKYVKVERKHKQMQNALYQILSNQYKNIKMEEAPDYSSKDKVDIMGKHIVSGEKHYFEVKTFNAKQSIREALGQILEYAHYPQKNNADKLFIVGLGKPTARDKEYIEFLRQTYNLPLWYRWYDEKKNNLSEEY